MSKSNHQKQHQYYEIKGDKLQSRVREQLKFDFYRAYMSVAEVSPERLGTLKDNLRAPIHHWFKYPAGFSYKLVEALIDDKRLVPGDWVLDPFVGCGTTSVVAKERGINSFGIEAHPFVWWVAKVKCFWKYDMQSLHRLMLRLISDLQKAKLSGTEAVNKLLALVHKCYSPTNLQKLDFIRDVILQMDCSDEERDFFLLALVDTLRTASKAGTGWLYIAPSKYHEKQERDAIGVFCHQVQVMCKDLVVIQERRKRHEQVECHLLRMDAREPYPSKLKALTWRLRHHLISTTTTTLTEQGWRCIFWVGPGRGETSLNRCVTNSLLQRQRKSAALNFRTTR